MKPGPPLPAHSGPALVLAACSLACGPGGGAAVPGHILEAPAPSAAAAVAVTTRETWLAVLPGLEVARLAAPHRAPAGDSLVTIVRVDPVRFQFRLLSAKLLGLQRNPTAVEWADQHGVMGVINASMFQTDHRTSVGYMRDGARVNSARWSRDNAVFAAQPDDTALPPVQIIDRQCQDLASLAPRYRVLVQSIRMIDCGGRNVWAPQAKRWSTACIGTDGQGRVLLIHCRSPFTTHELVEMLRKMPLGLRRLMYVEGGPEASLYLKTHAGVAVSAVGSFETGFRESDDNQAFWPLPNVIAFGPS